MPRKFSKPPDQMPSSSERSSYPIAEQYDSNRAGQQHPFDTGLDYHVIQVIHQSEYVTYSTPLQTPDRQLFSPLPGALQRDSAKIKELSAFEHIVSPETFASQRRPGPHTYGSRPAARAVHHHVCCTFRSLTGLSHLAVAINNPGQVPQSTSCLSVCVVTCLNPY